MVHTEPLRAREHLPHMPLLAAAAFSPATHFQFLRPRHAQYPHGSVNHYQRRFRRHVVSADSVMRVALADDADAFVDLGLQGPEAERSRWMRGKWVDGRWLSDELVDGKLAAKVAEGRILGCSQWTRKWPEDLADAKEVKERCGAGTVWTADSLWKKAERAAIDLEDAYWALARLDPSYDPERWATMQREGGHILTDIPKELLERSKRVGHIYLAAIAVDPTFHKLGIGARMMRWGLERAEVERCPILLIAAKSAIPFYRKIGFITYGTVSITGMTGDEVMGYWPKSFKDDKDIQELVVQTVEQPELKEDSNAATGAVEELTSA